MDKVLSGQEKAGNGIHTFTARSVRHALNDVRKTLGAEAMILSQERIGDRIVVRAALESTMSAALSSVSPAAEPAAAPAAAPESRPELTAAASGPDEMRIEVDLDLDPAQVAVAATNRPVTALEKTSRPSDLEYFGEPIHQLRGCYRLLGGSGVGKTTMIIRLMVQWVAHHGAQSLLVVSTDTARLAGRESLTLASEMLEVDFYGVAEAELGALVQQHLPANRLILVDTGALETIRPAAAVPQVKDILVCSAQHSRQALAGAFNRLGHADVAGIALSHLDLSADGEGLLKTIQSWQRPLYWLGTSADLRAGLEPADATRLEYLLFETEIGFDPARVNKLTEVEPARVHALA